jgi:hypothetical protein
VTQLIADKIVLRHGAPESIITDRGKCFLAGIKMYGKIWLSTIKPLTLAMMISMYITDEQTNWDEQLPFICFAYNTAIQESTGFSPFFLLYGREPNPCGHFVRLTPKSRVVVRRSFATIRRQINERFEKS